MKRIALHSELIHSILSADPLSISLCRLSPSGSSDQYCGWYWGGRITTQSPKWNATTPSSSVESSMAENGPAVREILMAETPMGLWRRIPDEADGIGAGESLPNFRADCDCSPTSAKASSTTSSMASNNGLSKASSTPVPVSPEPLWLQRTPMWMALGRANHHPVPERVAIALRAIHINLGLPPVAATVSPEPNWLQRPKCERSSIASSALSQ